MDVTLSQDQRTQMVQTWVDRVVDGYASETSRFLREQKDPFANPVGAGLREALPELVAAVCDGIDPEELEPLLDRVIRVRALQDMPPSEAVGFVTELKEVYDAVVDGPTADRLEFHRRVDRLLLTAFDVFSRCREQVCEIRVNEIRNRSLKVMERLNTWRERRDGGPLTDA
jgi:hypothetical protein